MEIIKNNYNENTQIEHIVTCPTCFSTLKCTEEEQRGLCPCCGSPLTFFTKTKCDHCGKLIECNSDDLQVGAYGSYYILCPYCKEKTFIDGGVEVTIDNLREEYLSDSTPGKAIPFNEIKEWIRLGIKFLKENPAENLHYTVSGNSLVMVTREGTNEYYVLIGKNYQDVFLTA